MAGCGVGHARPRLLRRAASVATEAMTPDRGCKNLTDYSAAPEFSEEGVSGNALTLLLFQPAGGGGAEGQPS